MAIGNAAIELLIKLRAAGYLQPGSAIIEIGAQQLSQSLLLELDRVAYLGSLLGVDRPLPFAPPQTQSESDEDWEILTAPFARDLWHWLGFRYAAIDIDNSPNSIPLDLNFDAVPAEAKGKFALVTNFGTTEHVANQLNAFKIIHDVTALNGLMIHEVPAQGMFNHGIVNYNFKFFWQLARSNGYKFIYADFTPDREPSAFPDNIEEFLSASTLATARQLQDYRAVDAGWLVVMQKTLDIDFVPPIDVNTGAATEIESLKKRYWTVFEPDRFDEFQAQAAATKEKRVMELPPSQSSQFKEVTAPLDAGAAPSASADPSSYSGRFGFITKLFRHLKRLVQNSDSSAFNLAQMAHHIIPNVTQTAHNTAATTAGIANQADMIRRKFDALTRVMYELREIQKAQLAMQRQAAEMIRQLAAAPARPPSNDKDSKA
jgi:hypothetical protein